MPSDFQHVRVASERRPSSIGTLGQSKSFTKRQLLRQSKQNSGPDAEADLFVTFLTWGPKRPHKQKDPTKHSPLYWALEPEWEILIYYMPYSIYHILYTTYIHMYIYIYIHCPIYHIRILAFLSSFGPLLQEVPGLFWLALTGCTAPRLRQSGLGSDGLQRIQYSVYSIWYVVYGYIVYEPNCHPPRNHRFDSRPLVADPAAPIGAFWGFFGVYWGSWALGPSFSATVWRVGPDPGKGPKTPHKVIKLSILLGMVSAIPIVWGDQKRNV